MKFRDEKQRKAMFAKLNKFSVCGCGSVGVAPIDIVGGIGDKIAGSIVKTYPNVETRGVASLWPDRSGGAPAVADVIEDAVIDAYPDGGFVDNYGEAFASGKAKEWARLNAAVSNFSLDEYGSVSASKFKKLKQDIDEAYGMGIYSDDEYKAKLIELNKKLERL